MANVTQQANQWHISGYVLMNNANLLLNETEAFAMEGTIEVDFAAVTDVDTAAISLMLEWQRRATASDCKIKFTHLPVDLISLATLYQVSDFISISAD